MSAALGVIVILLFFSWMPYFTWEERHYFDRHHRRCRYRLTSGRCVRPRCHDGGHLWSRPLRPQDTHCAHKLLDGSRCTLTRGHRRGWHKMDLTGEFWRRAA